MKKAFVFIFFFLSVFSVKSQELFPDERDSLRSLEIMKYIIENNKSIKIEMRKRFNVKFNLKQVNVDSKIHFEGTYIPDEFCNELAKKHFPEYLDSNAQIRSNYRINQLKLIVSNNLDSFSLYKGYLNRLDELTNVFFRRKNPVDSSQPFFTISFVSSYYEIKEVYIWIKGRYYFPGNSIYICFLFDDEDKIKDVFVNSTVG